MTQDVATKKPSNMTFLKLNSVNPVQTARTEIKIALVQLQSTQRKMPGENSNFS